MASPRSDRSTRCWAATQLDSVETDLDPMQSHTCLAAEGRRARAAKALIGSRRELLAIAAAIRSESITVISDYKIDEVLRSYVEWPWHGLGWKCEGYLEKVSGAES